MSRFAGTPSLFFLLFLILSLFFMNMIIYIPYQTPRVDEDYQLNFDQHVSTLCRKAGQQLTHKAPITTATEDKSYDIFPHF